MSTQPSKKLHLADSFYKTVQDQPPDRLKLLNERVDELAKFLETGHNPPSLSFKPLKGKFDNFTHGIYAWSDRDAKRLFDSNNALPIVSASYASCVPDASFFLMRAVVSTFLVDWSAVSFNMLDGDNMSYYALFQIFMTARENTSYSS